MSEHSPLPWAFTTPVFESPQGDRWLYSHVDKSKPVVKLSHGKQGDYEYIVRTANMHDELVKALEDALGRLDSLWIEDVQGANDPPHCPYDAYTKGMAVLEKAKGEA